MASDGRIIAIEGPSGAGKTTVVRAAARRLGWVPLPEAFDRLVRRPNLAFRTDRELLRIERALLREERRRYREALRLRRNGRIVIADTGFLGPLTYTAGLAALGETSPSVLSSLLKVAAPKRGTESWGVPDLIVYLNVSARARRRRAAGDPRRHPIGLDRRHEDVGRVEREFYRDLAARSPSRAIRFLHANRAPAILADRLFDLEKSLTVRRVDDRPTFATVSRRLLRRVRAVSGPRRERIGRHR
ncbi:MAG TPA: AAA family ATPase [Thermoplasmata archaeon]|nr:AAA family ATPase [Thermoplasmata archaeon]